MRAASGRRQGDTEGKSEREFEVPFGTTLCTNIPSDWHNNTGRDPPGQGAGDGRDPDAPPDQRRLSAADGGGVSRDRQSLDVGRLLLNYVLSDPYVDVALVGMREPRFVELNNEISDDVASRIDLAALHDRYVR